MHLGISGFNESDGEPFVMSLGGILDEQRIPGPVDKDRIEDLQIWSAVQALAERGAARHPLEIRPGDDPPDRLISFGTRTWGTELTALTVQDIRQDLAPVRMFARALQQRLRDRSEEFQHLRDRTVFLVKQRDTQMPRQIEPMLEELERALQVDRGYFGEDMDWTDGPPEQLGKRGLYGNCGAFTVTVNKTPGRGSVIISATSHFELSRPEALTALAERISAKDKPGNEIVIVTCGLPDSQGYVCPSDHDMFNVLLQATKDRIGVLREPPKHIQGVLVHLWGSNEIFSLGEGDDFPWVSNQNMA